METEESKKGISKRTIDSIIGISIMLFFRYLPLNLPGLTPMGMEVVGIFIGALWLWSTVEPLWSSLLSVIMVGFSSYTTMGKMMSQLLGNTTAIQTMFLMLFTASLMYYGITKYIVRACLTVKFANGKPWMVTLLLIGSSYLMAAFVGPFASIYLFMPIMYEVYREVGFTKEDAYVKITLILVMVMSVIGSVVAPYRSATLSLLSTYQNQAGAEYINDGIFFLYTFFLGCVILIVSLLVSKFILKPNVTPLKELDVPKLNKEALPPMTKQQKIIMFAFVSLIFFMLFPSLLQNQIPLMATLSQYSASVPMITVVVLSAIQLEGKPVFEFQKLMAKQFNWGTYFLTVVAIYFGGVLTAEGVGLTDFISISLGPLFESATPFMFTFIVLITSAFLTNISNSTVIGLLLIPVVSTFAVEMEMAAAPLITLLTFTVLSTATMTPGSSPYAAIMFGNTEWLTPKDIYKYAFIFLLVQLGVIIFLGIPLINIIL